MSSWFDFTRRYTGSAADLVKALEKIIANPPGADSFVSSVATFGLAVEICSSYGEDFFHTGGFSSDSSLPKLVSLLEPARNSLASCWLSVEFKSSVRDMLRDDSRNWYGPRFPASHVSDDDVEVLWATLDPIKAGPLGTLLVPYAETCQVPTRYTSAQARTAGRPVSYLHPGLLLETPLWLYRYVCALDPTPTPPCSPVYMAPPSHVRDFLSGLWTGVPALFERQLIAAHRLARCPVPSPLRLNLRRER